MQRYNDYLITQESNCCNHYDFKIESRKDREKNLCNVGPLTSIHPIVLLSVLQKTVTCRLLPSQLGFRCRCSKADSLQIPLAVCENAASAHIGRDSRYRLESCFRHHLSRQVATCNRVFRQTLQPTPAFHLMSSMLMTPILSVCHVRTLTMLSVSRQHTWQGGHSPSSRPKPKEPLFAG